MEPRAPYLTYDWYDPITHEYFCAECHDCVERRGEVVKDHVAAVWKHYGYVDYPGIKATDEQGRTKEREWAQPPRRVKVLLPFQSGLRFCMECFPYTPGEVEGTACATCADEVSKADHEYTWVECLWKRTNGANYPFVQGLLHLECLPPHFGEMHQARPKRTGTDNNE